MNYFCPSHIEFSTVMSYNFLLTQNVQFGRFVSENKSSEISVPYHAQRLENTTSAVHQHPSNSLRWHGTHSSFCNKLRPRLKGSQNNLALPQDYHYREQFETALKKKGKPRFL